MQRDNAYDFGGGGQRMVRVAMVVTNACAPDPRVLRHARWLHATGCEVTVHAFDRDMDHPMSENHEGVRIMRYRIAQTPYGGTWTTYRGVRAFHRRVIRTLLHDPPALVYCHDADTLRVGVALKQQRNVPFVFDMHDLQHTWVRYPSPESKVRGVIAGQMKQRMLTRAGQADLILTSSSEVGGQHRGFVQWLEHHGLTGVSVENRPEPPFTLPERPSNDGWTVGYVGRVRDMKAIEVMLKAVRSLPPHQRPTVRIAGDGVAASAVRRHLMDLVEQGEINAEVTGAFTQTDLPNILAQLDVMFAMYTPLRGNILQGALPVKMFDAAAHGIPTVVNDGCLMADVAQMEGLGVPAPWNDPVAIGEAMLQAKEMNVALEQDGEREHHRWLAAMQPLLAELQ